MEYKKFGDTVAIRVDRGEEIMASIKSVCEKEHITLGSISGIGAVDHVVVGLYRVAERKYYSNTLEGEMEMTSLLGNVTEKDGQVYLHLHAAFAKEDGKVLGGHLSEAVVSGTGEIFIHTLPAVIGRKIDAATGLNVFAF
jgi:predicted DNA-binding protein with PD1-like motif